MKKVYQGSLTRIFPFYLILYYKLKNNLFVFQLSNNLDSLDTDSRSSSTVLSNVSV